MTPRPTFAELFVAELQSESDITRRFIERVPDDKLAWRAHEKSHTIGALALHLAMLADQLTAASLLEIFPADKAAGGDWPEPASADEILAAHDAGLVAAEQRLAGMSDADYGLTWKATVGGEVVMSIPRHVMLRNVLFNHACHHRGQMGVYLRLIGATVPASYGPSGDEPPAFMVKR